MVDNMQAGRELDVLVGEIVMGWEVKTTSSSGTKYFEEVGLFTPSQSWNDMQLVVEEMQRRGLSVFLNNYDRHFAYSCNFRDESGQILGGAYSISAPHAVALAAIEALKESVE